MMVSPLVGAAAAGVADEYVAIYTHAATAVKGSYVPRLAFEAGLAAAGVIFAPKMAIGPKRNALLGASVGGAALLGTMLTAVVSGRIKL